MKTHQSCLPCFRRQAEYASQLATDDPALLSAIALWVNRYLEGLDTNRSPPENAIALYATISAISRCPDPFARLKRQSNSRALTIRPHVQSLIEQGQDRLIRAIKFAIAGNVIDYGSQQIFDLDASLQNCLDNPLALSDYPALREDLSKAKTVLYLADNCGEIVFDSMLIEHLPGTVTMAVKDGPIINDATMEHAVFCGLTRQCRVITNGTTCPGTPLSRCSEELYRLFQEADVVISKGQGNFETLSEERRPVYHLLTVKCPVVADHLEKASGGSHQLPIGTAVLVKMGYDQTSINRNVK